MARRTEFATMAKAKNFIKINIMHFLHVVYQENIFVGFKDVRKAKT